jgi:hypothetical protein
MRRPGEVLSRTYLVEHVWDFAYDGGSNVVDVYVRYLRDKGGPALPARVDPDRPGRGVPARPRRLSAAWQAPRRADPEGCDR